MRIIDKIILFALVCSISILAFALHFSINQNLAWQSNIFLSAIGILSMLTIGYGTFLMMEKSTKETVRTILKSSKSQIEEFQKITGQLLISNEKFEKNAEQLIGINYKLGNLYESMKILSDQVLKTPRLTVYLSEKSTRVEHNSYENIEINVSNEGNKVAEDVIVDLIFPKDFVVNPKTKGPFGLLSIGSIILDRNLTYFEDENRVRIRTESLNIGTKISKEVRIEAPLEHGEYSIEVLSNFKNADWISETLSITVT